jgi:hypothetical protein
MSAVEVVNAYYAAINAGDYRSAWNLGGDNLDSSYGAFVNGFAGTASDMLTVTGSQGDTVSVRLDAIQSDGSDQVYTGTYTVSAGHITGAQLAASGGGGGGQPSAPAPAPNAPILTPNGGYYRAGEYCPDADAGLTTVDVHGNTLTCGLESGRYHWHY